MHAFGQELKVCLHGCCLDAASGGAFLYQIGFLVVFGLTMMDIGGRELRRPVVWLLCENQRKGVKYWCVILAIL
jgi:hypothetical protein